MGAPIVHVASTVRTVDPLYFSTRVMCGCQHSHTSLPLMSESPRGSITEWSHFSRRYAFMNRARSFRFPRFPRSKYGILTAAKHIVVKS